jgi:hypothetical protein
LSISEARIRCAVEAPAIAEGAHRIEEIDEAAVYQTRLMADALRYTTLQLCASKESGHPGGFASSADAYAALVMLGAHQHPDRGRPPCPRLLQRHVPGRLAGGHGHQRHASDSRRGSASATGCSVTSRVPSPVCSPRPVRWGRASTSRWPAAYLHRETLFPVTIGDGGLGEPYILSAFKHFHTAYPEVTNFLPVLIWNGFSQEHHSMVSLMDNEQDAGLLACARLRAGDPDRCEGLRRRRAGGRLRRQHPLRRRRPFGLHPRGARRHAGGRGLRARSAP